MQRISSKRVPVPSGLKLKKRSASVCDECTAHRHTTLESLFNDKEKVQSPTANKNREPNLVAIEIEGDDCFLFASEAAGTGSDK